MSPLQLFQVRPSYRAFLLACKLIANNLVMAVFTFHTESRPASDTGNGTVGNSTSVAQVLTYIYTAVLADNVTTLEQSFAFHNETASTSFSGLSFDITPGSLKWSINITSAAVNSSEPLTMRYKLSSLGGSSSAVNASSINSTVAVTRQDNEPRANMTTYLFALQKASASDADLAVKVVVFDVVVVDGVLVPLLGHDVLLSNDSASSSSSDYVLVLRFPRFNHTLYYDPSLGLGLLLGGSKDNGGKTSSSGSSFLVVAVAVAVPIAVVVVVVVVISGTVAIKWRQKRNAARRRSAQIADNMHAL
jgi:hypothetical protein